LEGCLPGSVEVCLNAWDDNCNGIADEGCGIKTGLAHFLIAWDRVGSDVDLQVVDANGQLAEAGQITRAGLVKERDCPGRNDDCHGASIENVYLEAGHELPKGPFTVVLHLQKMSDKDIPVQVTLAVRLGSQSHAQRVTLTHEGDERRFRFSW